MRTNIFRATLASMAFALLSVGLPGATFAAHQIDHIEISPAAPTTLDEVVIRVHTPDLPGCGYFASVVGFEIRIEGGVCAPEDVQPMPPELPLSVGRLAAGTYTVSYLAAMATVTATFDVIRVAEPVPILPSGVWLLVMVLGALGWWRLGRVPK